MLVMVSDGIADSAFEEQEDWLVGLLNLVWMPGGFWISLWQAIRYGWPLELDVRWFQGSFSFTVSFPT